MSKLYERELSYHKLLEQFDDFLDEVYGEIEICGLQYSASNAFKSVDPIAYRCNYNDWVDSQLQDGVLEEVDGKYYEARKESGTGEQLRINMKNHTSKLLWSELDWEKHFPDSCADNQALYIEKWNEGKRVYYKLVPTEVTVAEYNAAWDRASNDSEDL